jgi:hypothetical protein
LRYLQTRPLGPGEWPEDRALFSAQDDTVVRWDAREALARWVTPGVAYHSLVLSPGPVGAGMTPEQMRDWTRHVMADLEQRGGGPVTWYAAVHQHTAHIHVHVIMAASRVSAGSARRATRLVAADFQALRESGDRWAEHEGRTMHLWQQVEWYAADLAGAALALARPSGGGGGGHGSGPTDRDEIERSLWPRR